MLTFFAHVVAMENGSAAGDKTDRVTAGVSVNTKKGVFRHGLNRVLSQRIVDCSPNSYRVYILKCFRQEVVGPVLIGHRSHPTADAIGSNGCEPTIGGGGEGSTMLHREGDANARRHAVQDKPAGD